MSIDSVLYAKLVELAESRSLATYGDVVPLIGLNMDREEDREDIARRLGEIVRFELVGSYPACVASSPTGHLQDRARGPLIEGAKSVVLGGHHWGGVALGVEAARDLDHCPMRIATQAHLSYPSRATWGRRCAFNRLQQWDGAASMKCTEGFDFVWKPKNAARYLHSAATSMCKCAIG